MSENFNIFNLSAYVSPTVKESNKNEWVEYGEDNNYFQYLIDCYNNSTTNSAIINNVSKLVYGRGLSALDANRKPNEYAQLKTLISDSDLRKIITDRKMLGQFALQVFYSKDRKKILKAYHIPVQLLRAEKCNKDGEIEAYYYSDNWLEPRKFVPKRLDAFGFGSGEVEILYYKPYSVGLKYYANVDYIGGLPYCVLESDIADYLINDVQNGFSGTKIVNFNNGVPSPEQQLEINNRVQRKLTGTKGQKVITSFNLNKDHEVVVTDIPLNDAPEHYQYLATEAMQKIMLSHNVTSPLLFGIATTTGFSSNADELKNSFILFDNMVIKPYQDEVIEAIDMILGFNGISLKLYFKTLQPLEFTDLENAQSQDQVTEETGTDVAMSAHDFTSKYGHDLDESWILIDDFDAVDLEDETDALNEVKLTAMDKVWNFVKTGKANPMAKSEQDDVVKDVKFMTRYRYTGKLSENTRPFCKAMLQADKLYRKEDIVAMSQVYLGDGYTNKDGGITGWGAEGALTFDRFKYKGGGDCHHVWRREVYATLNTDAVSPLSADAKKIATGIAEKRGYKVRNPYQVNVQPTNLPNNGFLPTNKRFQ